MDIISASASARVIDRHLDELFKTNHTIKTFLKNHPHRRHFEQALTMQLQTADARKALKTGPEFIDQTIREIVKFWAQRMIEFQEASLLSQNELRRQQDENRKTEIAKDVVRDIAPNIDEDDFDVEEV